MRSFASCLAAALLLAACSSAPQQTHRYFVLAPEGAPPASAAAPLEATLLVAPTTAAPFYDTQEMAFSRASGTRAYYQYSSWTEPPARSLSAMLVARNDSAHLFRTAMLATRGARGGASLLLRMHLDEIYHDAASPPGQARLSLTAELSDPSPQGGLIARRTFEASAPAASYDADGAAQAARRALAALLDDVSAWAARESSERAKAAAH